MSILEITPKKRRLEDNCSDMDDFDGCMDENYNDDDDDANLN